MDSMRPFIEKALLLPIFVVAQLLSHVQSFVMPWSSTPGFLVLLCLPEFTQTYAIGSEKAMAPDSSTNLAWKIPWTVGPGGLQSMGSLGVGQD